MRYISLSLLFILNKWNLSLEEFKPIGKFLFYIPNFLNNIITQIFYLCLFPIIVLSFYLKEKLEPYILLFRLFMIKVLIG